MNIDPDQLRKEILEAYMPPRNWADPIDLLVESLKDVNSVNEGRAEYITHMLGLLERGAPNFLLSSKEAEFVESASKQFASRGTLTDKQFSWLQDIYAKAAE